MAYLMIFLTGVLSSLNNAFHVNAFHVLGLHLPVQRTAYWARFRALVLGLGQITVALLIPSVFPPLW